MAKYKTTASRRVASSDALSFIDNYYSDKSNLNSRASSTLSNLLDENYTDARNRTVCLDCAAQISGAYQEGHYISELTMDSGNPASRWVGYNKIYLPSYSFVKEIRGLDNTLYDGYIDDLTGIWSLCSTYSTARGDSLYNWQDVFDDYCVRQRHIFKVRNSYEAVLNDAWWNGSSVSKTYKTVVSDVETIDYDTTAEPTLPTVAQFKSLIYFSNKTDNARYYLDRMVNTQVSDAPDKDWFKFVKIEKNNVKYNCSIICHDDNYSEEFANTVIKELNSDLFFISNDKKNHLCAYVVSKKKQIVESLNVKDAYDNNFNSSEDEVKRFIYNSYKDIYYKNRYVVKIDMLLNYTNIESDEDLILTSSAGLDVVSKVMENYKNKAVDKLSWGFESYKNASEKGRSDNGNPEAFYPDTMKKLNSIDYNSLEGCKISQTYAAEAVKWIDTRKKVLRDLAADENNAEKLVQALNKRLDKNTGTFMMWYQSLISADKELISLKRSEKMTKCFLKDILVSKALNKEDSKTFSHQMNPNYIDIENIDSLYNSYGYKFNKGDTIYIIDDTHSEIKAVVKNVSKITVSTTKYDNVSLEDYNGGEMNGTVTVKENFTRLELDVHLPDYYCRDNDISSLRVLKLIV